MLLCHHNNTAVLAHADDVELLFRVFVHPVLALEFCHDAFDRTLHSERLAATDALGRFLLFNDAGQCGGSTEIDLRFEAYHLFRTGCFAQSALDARILGKSQHWPLGIIG